jgi:hypothetical protein
MVNDIRKQIHFNVILLPSIYLKQINVYVHKKCTRMLMVTLVILIWICAMCLFSLGCGVQEHKRAEAICHVCWSLMQSWHMTISVLFLVAKARYMAKHLLGIYYRSDLCCILIFLMMQWGGYDCYPFTENNFSKIPRLVYSRTRVQRIRLWCLSQWTKNLKILHHYTIQPLQKNVEWIEV